MGGGASDLFPTLGLVVPSLRHWTHYVNLMVAGSAVLVLYNILWRFALIPRALAAFGMAAALLQIAAVTMPLLGYPIMLLLITPLGLSHLALSLWLIIKGLAERHSMGRADAREVELAGA